MNLEFDTLSGRVDGVDTKVEIQAAFIQKAADKSNANAGEVFCLRPRIVALEEGEAERLIRADLNRSNLESFDGAKERLQIKFDKSRSNTNSFAETY